MSSMRNIVYFLIMAALFVLVGQFQSWNLSLSILNLCIISSVMALGVNMQWGYAGLFNAGIMGFAALGGLAAIVVSMPPVREAWAVGRSCRVQLSQNERPALSHVCRRRYQHHRLLHHAQPV